DCDAHHRSAWATPILVTANWRGAACGPQAGVRSHAEERREARARRAAGLEIEAIDDGQAKAPRRHGVRGGRTIVVEGDLHAAHVRHAPHLRHELRGRMPGLAAVRAAERDSVAPAALARRGPPLAPRLQPDHGREPPALGEARPPSRAPPWGF